MCSGHQCEGRGSLAPEPVPGVHPAAVGAGSVPLSGAEGRGRGQLVRREPRALLRTEHLPLGRFYMKLIFTVIFLHGSTRVGV